MKAFFKENFVLIAGLALPLVLALVFYGATQAGRVTAEPPQYRMVFATDYYPNNNNLYRIEVENREIRLRYRPPPRNDEYRHYSNNVPRLFLFDPAKGNVVEITLPIIENEDKKANLAIPDLQNLLADKSLKSPDGYIFEQDYHRNGNLMTELFGGGSSYRNGYVLRKDGARFPVPLDRGRYYNAHFVAWITGEKP